MRLKSMLGLLVLTASLACKDDGGQGPSDALGALAAAGGQVIDAGADVTAPAVIADDPGPPASFYGSKCTVIMEGEARPGPECISSPIESKGGRTHLFLQLLCGQWREPLRRQGPAGLRVPRGGVARVASRDHHAGRASARAGGPDRRAPLRRGRDRQRAAASRAAHRAGAAPTEKNVLAGTLQVTVPRIDAPGPALRLRAQIP
jgi:hypothetical protein